MAKVTVWLPYRHAVPYEIRVGNPENLEEIREALRKKAATEWKIDPSFYQALGENFADFIDLVTHDDVVAQE